MTEISTEQVTNNLKLITVKGRIDGLSAPDLEKELESLTLSGERTIAVDFSYVAYISSAGLRIFLQTQKSLKKIGGELILVSLPDNILEVFRVSGFISLFNVVKSISILAKEEPGSRGSNNISTIKVNNLTAEYLKIESKPGRPEVIGSQNKLNSSSYTISDVVEVEPGSIKFGTGLAALGSSYDEYKNLFGEAMIINNSFFFYPAVKSSRVDYMLANQIDALTTYKFLHGFSFNGNYSLLVKFDEQEALLSLTDLITVFNQLISSNIYGITFIGTSGGTLGMNLKRSPVAENASERGNIFEQPNFMEWIDFPIDPVFSNHILAGTGIAAKDKSKLTPELKSIFSSDSTFHIHTGIFEKDLLCKNLQEFDKELNRILSELQVVKIQHLLGRSLFKNGIFGIVELEA